MSDMAGLLATDSRLIGEIMSTSTQISGIPSKKARNTDHVEHDYISNLPDCVISHILSRLPTKDAMSTSVLSKDWEYKWTSIQDINLDDLIAWENENKRPTFVKFVERTLLLSQNIQSFRLSCYNRYDLSRMETWISSALSHNLHYLAIKCINAGGLVLPRNLLNCYSLRELQLDMLGSPYTLKVPATIHLPHLTTLCLSNIEILNEVSPSNLVKFNFPVLERFELRFCDWFNVMVVEIYAPKMTKFMYMTTHSARVNDYSIKIIGDSLVNFECCADLTENIVLSGSTVVYAVLQNTFGLSDYDDLRFPEKSGLQIRKLLEGFSSLRDLELLGNVAKALFQSKSGLSLPIYYRMDRLALYSCDNSEVLLELLHAAPFLKFLVIDVHYFKDDYDFDAMEHHVPSCVVSHLEEVEFTWFSGTLNEVKLALFFIENAVKLKSMRVHCQPWMPKEEMNMIQVELFTYRSASACLSIVAQ